MENDKAVAWLTLADADAVENKVVDVIRQLLDGSTEESRQNLNDLGNRLGTSYTLSNMIFNNLRPQIQGMIKDAVTQNFKIDHYYESWNRTAGYRIRYGDHVIQTEQIKIGF